MNRRTFLKSVGAASALISTSIAMAKTPEPQWINFVDGEYPKILPPIPFYNYLINKPLDGISFVEFGVRRKSKFWKNRSNNE